MRSAAAEPRNKNASRNTSDAYEEEEEEDVLSLRTRSIMKLKRSKKEKRFGKKRGRTPETREEVIKRARGKLSKNIPARARRSLRRLIEITLKEYNTVNIPEEIRSFYTNNQKLEATLIVDSGTVHHLYRNRDDFANITNERVRIRGVSGISYGLRGTLKPSPLGKNIPAIWYKDLPVDGLLSTTGLKANGWETFFLIGCDMLRHIRSGQTINLHQNPQTRLPSLQLTFSSDVNELPDNISYLCTPCSAHDATPPPKTPTRKKNPIFKDRSSRLLQHQRLCHMHAPDEVGTNVRCLDCLECKGKSKGARKERPAKFSTKKPMLLFSADFFGKVKPESIQGNQWCLVFICDECGYAQIKCLAHKHEAPVALAEFTKTIRKRCGNDNDTNPLIVAGIHTDNEPVLRGDRWKRACDKLRIEELHSVPYQPQMNGTCERFIQSIKDSLRTTMSGVDSRLWDFAIQHITKVWNMKHYSKTAKHSGDGKITSPNEILAQTSKNPFYQNAPQNLPYLRRFGCLAFFKPWRTPTEIEDRRNKVLLPKRLKGVHLGFSDANSAWIIGSITPEGRFSVYETRSASFCEDILVRDVRALDPISNPDPPLVQRVLNKLAAVSDGPASAGTGLQPVVGEIPEYQTQGLIEFQWPVSDSLKEVPLSTTPLAELKTEIQERHLSHKIADDPQQLNIEADGDVIMAPEKSPAHRCSAPADLTKNQPTPKSSPQASGAGYPQSSEGVKYGPTAPLRRRGRPRGSTDKNRRVRRTKKQMQETNALLAEENDYYEDMYSHLAINPDEETLLEADVFLVRETPAPSQPGDSVKPSWAFSEDNPERPRWIEAKEKEEVRLNAYKTWRKLSPEEEQQWQEGKLRAVPCALLLNRKRCGRYKGRLVVLGNRWKPDGDNNVYASVVSQVGNRASIVHSAKNGYHVIPFDIGNAFVRASMGDIKVAITLPPTFRDNEEDNGRRMLLKALYGLPISPRLWAKTLGRDLKRLGWTECISEPGVWRKEGVGLLTVYVDDCVLACKSAEIAERECEAVHKAHPLSRIETKIEKDGSMTFDLTGADITYNAEKRTVKISMKNYINKMLKRFDMLGAKPRSTPNFEEKNLYDKSSKPSEFPFKAAIGALQWATTCGRPDINHAVNTLARAGAEKVTTSMARCARLVFRYLIKTIDYCIEYSPESERQFEETYGKIAKEGEENTSMKEHLDQVEKPIHLFTDASFGVEYKTLKSITGIVVYLHGTPIAWKSKVQTVFTSCTTQSEWVAMADGLEHAATIYGLLRFLLGQPEAAVDDGPLWSDNRGAVLIGRKGNEQRDEIPKRSRHVALRFARVLDEKHRLFWCPTGSMKADGLTKSGNPNALKQILVNGHTPLLRVEDDEDNEELDQSHYYFAFLAQDRPGFLNAPDPLKCR